MLNSNREAVKKWKDLFSVSERRLSNEVYRNQVSGDLLGLDTS